MSGPIREEQLYWLDADQWNRERIRTLRQLADRVEEWPKWTDGVEDTDSIAQLFRAKADKIESALDLIEKETHDDFEDLVKSAQYVESGDYAPHSTLEAWKKYGETDQ